MGDFADDALSGFLCEQCGELIDGDAPGYPRLCGCCKDDGEDESRDEEVD